MDNFKRFLSFLIPITKKVPSRYSGTLEISWINGKKLLDTRDANYSYGALQRVLNYTLDEIDLSRVNSVLLLGLGGGSVIRSLRGRYRYRGYIRAVEIDPKIIEIAAKEFDLLADGSTEIICDDAYNFIRKDPKKHDLIIVDITIGKRVPEKFLTNKFWDLLLPKAEQYIIFNSMESEKRIQKLSRYISKVAKVTDHFNVEGSNQMLIIDKISPA